MQGIRNGRFLMQFLNIAVIVSSISLISEFAVIAAEDVLTTNDNGVAPSDVVGEDLDREPQDTAVDVVEDTSLPALSLDNLDVEQFRSNIKNGKWFIKFYAPWCRHCQALAPIWDKLAKHVHAGPFDVNVAKLDCTKQPDACAALGISGYPSLQFFANENVVPFKNLRNFDTLLSFVERAVKPSVMEIVTQDDFDQAQMEHSVFFLTLLQEDRHTDDEWEIVLPLFTTQTKFLAHHYFTRSSAIAKTVRDKVATGVTPARVVVVKDGDHQRYTGGAQALMVAEFVKQQQFPHVAEMSHLLATTLKKEFPSVRLIMIVADPDADLSSFLPQAIDIAKLKEFNGKVQLVLMDSTKWKLTVELKWPHLVGHATPSVIAMDTQTQSHYILPSACVTNVDGFNLDSPMMIEELRQVLRNNVTWSGGKDVLARIRTSIFNVFEGLLVSFAAMQAEYPTLIHMSVASTLMLLVVVFKQLLWPSPPRATQPPSTQKNTKIE